MQHDTPTGNPEFSVTFSPCPAVSIEIQEECRHAVDHIQVETLEQATDTIDDILIGYGFRSCSFEVAVA